MSRGFVREDDQEEPPFVPPRAALPSSVENFVTAFGFEALQKEKKTLIHDRKQTNELSDRERRRENAVIDERIKQLDERISSARILSFEGRASEVRFGCTVSYHPIDQHHSESTFQIVGVDEADIKQMKVSFMAPIVQAMMGKKVGEEFEFNLGGSNRRFKVSALV